jgi:D-3-phosphoglycerate dehydrogenase
MIAAAINGVLKPSLGDINMVSAPQIAKDRGIAVETTTRDRQGAYEGYIRLTVTTERQVRGVAGTLFANGKPRIIQVKDINMEAELTPSMLYVTNEDKPGHIGRLGTILGKLGINIANFNLGRADVGADAIALVSIDGTLTEPQLAEIAALEGVRQAKALRF